MIRKVLSVVVGLVLMLSTTAYARGGHGNGGNHHSGGHSGVGVGIVGGLIVGGILARPYYYPPPYYSPPGYTPYILPPEPYQYRGMLYCNETGRYYYTGSTCPGPWQEVTQ